MTDLSDYTETSALNILLRATSLTGAATVYMALYTANPTDAGAGTEAAFASYARQAVTFSAPSAQTVTNSNTLTYAAVTVGAVTITAIGILDAASAGNLLAWKALSPTLAYAINDVPLFDVGAITVNIPTTAGIGLSDYAVDKILNVHFRNTAHTGAVTVYLGLFTASPTAAGGGTEFAHSGYARQAIAFAAPSGGASSNSGALTFPAVATSSHTLTALAVFDALTGGNMLNLEILGATVAFAVGNVPKVAVSGYTVTMA